MINIFFCLKTLCVNSWYILCVVFITCCSCRKWNGDNVSRLSRDWTIIMPPESITSKLNWSLFSLLTFLQLSYSFVLQSLFMIHFLLILHHYFKMCAMHFFYILNTIYCQSLKWWHFFLCNIIVTYTIKMFCSTRFTIAIEPQKATMKEFTEVKDKN